MNKPIFKILASAVLLIIGFVCGTFYNKSNDEPKKEIVTSGSDFDHLITVEKQLKTVTQKCLTNGLTQLSLK